MSDVEVNAGLWRDLTSYPSGGTVWGWITGSLKGTAPVLDPTRL